MNYYIFMPSNLTFLLMECTLSLIILLQRNEATEEAEHYLLLYAKLQVFQFT